MRAGHAEPFGCAGERAEHLGALLHREAVLAEVGEFRMVGGDGGRIDHERVGSVEAGGGDEARVVFIMDVGPLLAELFRQFARGAVVAAHGDAFRQEVAFERAHADAAGTDEIC